MRKHKTSILIVLLLTISVSMLAPAASASASAVTDLLPQIASASASGSSASSSSGGGFMNILIGLLLGKLFGNITTTDHSGIGSVLGATTAPAATDGGSAIISTAKKYMGTPYVWGGETPAGFDCSGFTQYVMKENGINLPRTAADQFATGTSVDKDSLQAGDLVFFTTYKPGASHVGFYMGNDQFIHASSSAKQVTISNLSDDYYTSHYIGARRYGK